MMLPLAIAIHATCLETPPFTRSTTHRHRQTSQNLPQTPRGPQASAKSPTDSRLIESSSPLTSATRTDPQPPSASRSMTPALGTQRTFDPCLIRPPCPCIYVHLATVKPPREHVKWMGCECDAREHVKWMGYECAAYAPPPPARVGRALIRRQPRQAAYPEAHPQAPPRGRRA